MQPIVIYGAGGMGREVMLLINQINNHSKMWKILGFIDDGIPNGRIINGYEVLGNIDFLNSYQDQLNVAIGIGDPTVKETVVKKITNSVVRFPTLIHPDAQLEDVQNISIGKGSVITSGNILTLDINIGEFVLINLKCTITHDVKIGRFSSLMPGCHISGNVEIADNVYIGAGAVLINQVKIGSHSTIGAGSVVLQNVPEKTKVAGVPARPILKSTKS